MSYRRYETGSLRRLKEQCEQQYQLYVEESSEQARKGNRRKSNELMEYAMEQQREADIIWKELLRRESGGVVRQAAPKRKAKYSTAKNNKNESGCLSVFINIILWVLIIYVILYLFF